METPRVWGRRAISPMILLLKGSLRWVWRASIGPMRVTSAAAEKPTKATCTMEVQSQAYLDENLVNKGNLQSSKKSAMILNIQPAACIRSTASCLRRLGSARANSAMVSA